jgi:D-alanyl-D-alanine carboxypeptidase
MIGTTSVRGVYVSLLEIRTSCGHRHGWPGPCGVALAVTLALLAGNASAGRSVRAGNPTGASQQQVLDALVSGPHRIAPGVTAYVSGPHGTWTGAAGVADVGTGAPMTPDTRLRLTSVSKLWTAVVVLRLVQQGKLSLDDTVQQRLPGVLPYGRRITVRQLLNHTSGMVDSNDIVHFPQRYMRQIKDPALRAKVTAISKKLAESPGYEVSPRVWVAIAAALPLLLDPGSVYHYSNIGYDVAGLIAERVGRAGLATLIRREITGPLGLRSAAYDPHSRITGPHAHGYRVAQDGKLTDTTTWTMGIGAGGSMVSDAADEAGFLTGLMRGKLLRPALLTALKTPSSISRNGLGVGIGYALGTAVNRSGCAGIAFGHNGGLDGFETNVFVSGTGERVAVLLLNGRTADDSGDETAFQAMNRLYCAA